MATEASPPSNAATCADLVARQEPTTHRPDAFRAEAVNLSTNRIVLDVGGTLFVTSKATLIRVKGSYFDAMLSSGAWHPDEPHNTYFVDLNPAHFDRILDFLRTGHFSLEGLSPWECQRLKANFDYLNLPLSPLSVLSPTQDDLAWDSTHCSQHIELCDGNQMLQARGTLSKYSFACVLGTCPVSLFHVQLENFGNDNTLVGLTTKNHFRANPHDGLHLGYCLSFDGNLFGRNGTFGKPYGFNFVGGDVLTVRFERGDISFARNGEYFGVAFTLDPFAQLYPIIATKQPHIRISFVAK
ncbi:Aste57867_3701 [Aphanomyces stellatus]|uniref:Aste57867_3701 protein n=1 Tax=Aphanomyces stellatus TaxID=120398 RepID=A0A485KB87_9STRA|nr:hypothetical protein As57867_003690 [Aphanomyces stellatus]VFT80855.1 Aste57867_3701 [Aphanomyces stellatus]